MDQFDKIQYKYVSEMRDLQKKLIKWWLNVAGISDVNASVPREVAIRWPTGFSGHPSALAVFRRYFMQIESLNDQIITDRNKQGRQEKPAEIWGTDEEPGAIRIRRPVDILISEIETAAPDIYKFCAGFVLIPVGLNQYNEPV